MKTRITFLLVLTFIASFAQDKYPRNENIDIQHYTFQLHLNDSTDVISGLTTVNLIAKKDVSEFELDLTNKTKQGTGMVVQSVSYQGKVISHAHTNDRLKISLPEKVMAGKQAAVTINYSGIPAGGLIIDKNKFGDRTFFGDNWPNRAHNWLPVMDHPYEKAGVDFIVIAPAHYDVIGNGIKLEESWIEKNQKLTHWHEDVPIAPKVMVIGAARFAIEKAGDVNNIEVSSWVYPQNRLAGFYDYKVATRVLDFFINHVGEYSYKKLANVQSKTLYGGMENASNIFYYENSVTGKATVESLIAHEVAHQWFGNSASENDWNHVWLSEGFATYFTHLYNEFTHGIDKRKADMAKDRGEVIDFFKKSPAPILTNATSDFLELLNANAYQKGGWVLHMLRKELGDDIFWEGIRTYYKLYQNSNALTGDFQRVMETVSGKDLAWFFNQWLTQPGYPILSGNWKGSDKSVELQITQSQKDGTYQFPLEIAFYNDKNELISVETIKISNKTEKISIPIKQKPSKIALDPNINLLFEGVLKNLSK